MEKVLLHPPKELQKGKNPRHQFTAVDVLSWQKQWGTKRASRFLNQIDVSTPCPIRDLSPPTRERIAKALR